MELRYIKNLFETVQFLDEIGELKNKITGIKHEQGILVFYLAQALTEAEKSQLDGAVEAHVADFIPGIISKTVQENKAFANNMMHKLKQKNLLQGLNSIDQAAWVHHRLRKIDYVLSFGLTVQLDVLNLVVSGDLETAEHCLGQMLPDNMEEPYHWWTQERINWIRNEIRVYLGWPAL